MEYTDHFDSMLTLKNCPFCGGEPILEESARIELRSFGYCNVKGYSIRCQDEHCIGSQREKYWTTEEMAAKAWNRRVGDQ